MEMNFVLGRISPVWNWYAYIEFIKNNGLAVPLSHNERSRRYFAYKKNIRPDCHLFYSSLIKNW